MSYESHDERSSSRGGFADRLRAARKAQHYTQTELGKRAGFNQASISDFERCRTFPRLPGLRALADALGLKVEQLKGTAEIKLEPRMPPEPTEESTAPEPTEAPSVAETAEPPPLERTPRVASQTVYIAGPMRGMIDLNWLAFDKAEQALRERGLGVVNPVTLDREAGITLDTNLTNKIVRAAIMRDLKQIEARCDGIALLSGWHKSKGCKAEAALGHFLNIPVNPLWWWLQICRTKPIRRRKAR